MQSKERLCWAVTGGMLLGIIISEGTVIVSMNTWQKPDKKVEH